MAYVKKTAVADAPKAPRRIPRVSVLERRLQNPFGEGSSAIILKEEGWTTHVINTKLRAGRYHDVVRNKGWVPVDPTDLEGDAETFGFDVKDGKVVRGERGEEVLVKMPTEDYRAIQMAKDAKNRAAVSPKRLKADVLTATAAEHGSEAADYLHDNITIKDSRGPVPLDEPAT